MSAGRHALLARLDGLGGPLEAAALFQGGRLEDLTLRPAPAEGRTLGPQPEEIYRARVDRALPDAGAAFLDLGGAVGFLADARGVAPGDMALVQIRRAAEGRKAAEATRKLEFAGRLLAHTPSAPGVNVSRKISDPEVRERLGALLAPFAGAGGWVVRTAAAGAEPDAIRAEAERLAAAAGSALGATGAAVGTVCAAPDLAEVAERNWGVRLEDARGEGPDGAGAERLVEALVGLCSPVVALPSGGRLAFGRMEALIAVDVDAGDGPRAAANWEAAKEIPRQLRLRGWGGMVLIDFAGEVAKERDRLAAALKKAAAGDPLRVAGWGPLELLEAARRRDRPALETLWSLS